MKDHCLGNRRALLGMNVIAACWEELFKTQHGQTSAHPCASEGHPWGQILADCRRIHATRAQQDSERTARVACRYAIAIPAESEALV